MQSKKGKQSRKYHKSKKSDSLSQQRKQTSNLRSEASVAGEETEE